MQGSLSPFLQFTVISYRLVLIQRSTTRFTCKGHRLIHHVTRIAPYLPELFKRTPIDPSRDTDCPFYASALFKDTACSLSDTDCPFGDYGSLLLTLNRLDCFEVIASFYWIPLLFAIDFKFTHHLFACPSLLFLYSRHSSSRFSCLTAFVYGGVLELEGHRLITVVRPPFISMTSCRWRRSFFT